MYDQGRTKWRNHRLAHTARSDAIFSHKYLVTCEVNLTEILEIMAQMGQCNIHYNLPETNKGDFRHYFESFEKKL